MIIISHRGNIRGPIPDKENRPSYIDCAIGNGYHVEIDVRSIDGELWLGHDEPQYRVEHNWIEKRKEYLWLHCKNLDAAKECWRYNSFCHTQDSFIYTSNGKIWLHDLSHGIDKNVIIPLIDKESTLLLADFPSFNNAFGVCTDYPALI